MLATGGRPGAISGARMIRFLFTCFVWWRTVYHLSKLRGALSSKGQQGERLCSSKAAEICWDEGQSLVERPWDGNMLHVVEDMGTVYFRLHHEPWSDVKTDGSTAAAIGFTRAAGVPAKDARETEVIYAAAGGAGEIQPERGWGSLDYNGCKGDTSENRAGWMKSLRFF